MTTPPPARPPSTTPADTDTRAGRRPLLTIDQAAAYLNVPARWVADAVRQHKIRCTRIGKHVRFRQEHLDELVNACEQPVTTPPQTRPLALQPSRHGGRSRL